MQSYEEYLHDLVNREINTDFALGFSLDEMAQRAVKRGDSDVHETRKIPVFFDKHDIAWLYQFPPEFWKQAIVLRYNDLLFQAENLLAEGRQIPVRMDIPMKWRSRRGHIVFPKVHIYMRELHDKLTRDTNDRHFMGDNAADHEEHRASHAEGGHGNYGYVLENPKRGGGVAAAEGVVGVGQDIRKRLTQWMQGIKDGWLGQDVDNFQKAQVSWGGGRDKTAYPVYGKDQLSQHSDDRFGVTKEGHRVWRAYDEQGNEVTFTSPLPVLRPAKMFDRTVWNAYKGAMEEADRFRGIAESPREVEEFMQLMRGDLDGEIQRLLEEKASLGSQKRSEGDSGRSKQMLQQIREIDAKLQKLGMARQAKQFLTQKHGSIDALDAMNQDDRVAAVGELSSHFHQQAKQIQKDARRIDEFTWNLHYFQPGMSGVDAVGIGTINPNKQQKGRVTGGHDEEKWKSIAPMVGQSGEVELDGQKIPMVDAYTDASSDKHGMLDGQAYSLKSLKKQMNDRRGELDRLQSVSSHLQQTPDASDEDIAKAASRSGRKVTAKYVAEVRKMDGDEVEIEMQRIQRRIAELKHTYYDTKRRVDTGDTGKTQVLWGPIGSGINKFLRQPSVFGTPEYFAMKNLWQLIFQNALNFMSGQTGQGAIDRYLQSCEAKGGDRSRCYQMMWRKVEKLAFNYASSVWQLDLGQGTRRMREKTVEPTGTGAIGKIIAKAEDEVANARRYRLKSRTDTPDLGTTGHSIQVLKQIIKQSEDEAQSTLGPETTDTERQMTSQIIDMAVGFAAFRQLIITEKIRRGEEWSMRQVNQEAEVQTQEYMKGRGVKLSGHQGVSPEKGASIKKIVSRYNSEKQDILDRLERMEVGQATGDPGYAGSRDEQAEAQFIQRFLTLAQQRGRGEAMRALEPIIKKVEANPNSPDSESQRKLIDKTLQSLGVVPHFGATPQGQADRRSALADVVQTFQNPAIVPKLTPGDPKYNAAFRKWADQYATSDREGAELVRTALQKADQASQRSAG